MSPPINPDSAHRRVLASLAAPKTVADVAAELGMERRPVSRAIWHMQRRGLVQIVSRHPRRVYACAWTSTINPAMETLRAMQCAARGLS